MSRSFVYEVLRIGHTIGGATELFAAKVSKGNLHDPVVLARCSGVRCGTVHR